MVGFPKVIKTKADLVNTYKLVMRFLASRPEAVGKARFTVVKQTSAMTVRHTRRLPPLSVLMIAWKRAWRIITI